MTEVSLVRVRGRPASAARPRADPMVLGGKSVGRLGYGAALRVGGRPGTREDLRDLGAIRRLLRRAVDLGITFLDTADSYGPCLSEELIAEALRPYPPGLLIATKGGVVRSGRDRTLISGRPARLRAACEGSLRRLGTEALDLYQLHWRDPDVPFEDQVGALAELVREGKVRHVGLCNLDVPELERARAITPVASVQCAFGLGDRRNEALMRHCAERGIAFIAHSPLSVLRRGTARPPALALAARQLGATEAQVALAWVLHRAPNSLVIPGTLRSDHLEENLGARDLHLPASVMAALGP